MASLRKTLVTAYDYSSGVFSFDIPKTFNLKNFTVEANFSGISYPASENDGFIALQDSEDDTTYETVLDGLCKIAGGQASAKIRLVDLNTKNVRIVFDPASMNGGTLDSLEITFQS